MDSEVDQISIESAEVTTDTKAAKKTYTWSEEILLKGPDWVTTIRKLRVTVEDNSADPNYFSADIEFEYEGNVREEGVNMTTLSFNLVKPDKTVVGAFAYKFIRRCGLRLERGKVESVKAIQYNAVQRSSSANGGASYYKRIDWC